MVTLYAPKQTSMVSIFFLFVLFQNEQVGDWVRVKASVPSPKYGWEDVTRTSIGIIHSLEEDGDMGIAFCFRSKTFSCSMTDMEKVSPFEVGQEIRVMPSINEPLLGWSNETPSTSGKIERIDMDGTLNVSMLISYKYACCLCNLVVGIIDLWREVCWCLVIELLNSRYW